LAIFGFNAHLYRRGGAVNNSHPHVLLIEDNPGDADLVRLRIVESRSDVDVHCVDRLSAGLDHLALQAPALVLLDLNLPDSHGAETFRKLLSKAPGVPVVVLSGQDDEELALKAVHQGVQDYLVKGSFDGHQLARAMHYAMERQALITSLDMSRRQQLQFKNQFLSHVSHELRTPLTCIYQFVTILLDGLAGPVSAEQRDHLTTVLKSANQLRSMIADLLEATRAESGKIRVEPQCLLIGEVIHQALSMLRTTAQQKQIGLETGVDTRIPLVYADSQRVLQVLINLIDNAIKFTPPEGSIMVKACMVEPDPEFVYISVADTGRGISPEARSLVFERLYQDPDSIDDSRKGLGLGLYIAKEIVQLHGGRIWVDSEPGHGSVFTFTLPLFSLAKLLSPVLTKNGRLRGSLSLITVEVTPTSPVAMGSWREIRQRCAEVLRGCIRPDEDLLLPTLGIEQVATCLILASTDQPGTEIIIRRIREQLARIPELQSGVEFIMSAIPVQLPSSKDEEPSQKLLQEIGDSVTELIMASLLRPKAFRATAN
jgi:signal transduction histidine kinase